MKTMIDSSQRTHLAVCTCGWRGDPRPTRLAALSQARQHETRAHPGDQHVANMLNVYRWRHSGVS